MSEQILLLEDRVITTGDAENAKDAEQEIKVLVIDKPEKWLPATAFKYTHSLSYPGTGKVIKFPVRGISYGEYKNIETTYPYPEQVSDTASQQEKDAREDILREMKARRFVKVFELSTGKSIPGERVEDKTKWLSGIGVGEADGMFTAILERYSGFNQGPLAELYNQYESTAKQVKIVEFVDFKDWMDASDSGLVYRGHRDLEGFIIEIPLKKFSDEDRLRIDRETKEPLPPGRIGKNPATGRPDPNHMVYNHQDAGYLKAIADVEVKKTILRLEALLPWTIPGDSIDQKSQWISDRLLGDIILLERFIELQVVDYRSRYNFFTEG